jgi:hypothetical protein
VRTRIMPEPTGQFKPVDSWNIEIGDDYVRAGIECPLQRLQSVVSLIDAEASLGQPVGVHTSTVPIIFDKENDRSRRRRDH